jgi:cell division septal protein FtsQ
MKIPKESRQFGGAMWAATTMAVALALFFGVRIAIELSPFVVEKIEVRGNAQTPSEEVVSASGLLRGQSLFQKKLARIKEDVEKLPWIHSAKISRRLPGSVVIEVEESKPSFLIRLSDRLYYFSLDGKVIDAPLKAGIDFPVITGLDWEELEGDSERREQVLELLKYADPASLGGRIEEIHCHSPEKFVIYGNFPLCTRIVVGAGDFAEKFKDFARLKRKLDKRGQYAKSADLTLDDRIIARLDTMDDERGTR